MSAAAAEAMHDLHAADPVAAIRKRLAALSEPGRPVMSIVRRAVDVTGIPADKLLSPSRSEAACWVRFAIMLAATRASSQSNVARVLQRDASTIISGLRRARELVRDDPAFATLVEVLTPVEILDD